jgi:hypothetical protein
MSQVLSALVRRRPCGQNWKPHVAVQVISTSVGAFTHLGEGRPDMSLSTFRFSGKRRIIAIGLSAATLIAAVAVVAVMALGARTALGSGSGGGGCVSTTGPACTFKNNNAYVYVNNASSDGCIYTNAQISLYDSLSNPSGATTQSVTIYISKWDVCNNVSLLEASNFDPNTWMPSFTGTIQLSSDLSTAKVTGTATMYNWVSNVQSFTTNLDLTLKGYGPTSKYSDNQHFQAPGFIMNNHSTGTSRSAFATGTFTDDTGANLTMLSAFGDMNNSSGGTVQIIKQ